MNRLAVVLIAFALLSAEDVCAPEKLAKSKPLQW